MRRRRFTASSAGVAMGLTGCLDLLRDDPEEVVRRFIGAIDDGDAEAANELIHGDSPMGEYSAESLANLSDVDLSVENTELVKESGDAAEVRGDVRMARDSRARTVETKFELRTEWGSWKIWEMGRADDGSDRTEQLQANVTVDTDPEANTITLQFVSNRNVDYLEATVEAGDAPGWEDDGRLEEVGEKAVFHAGSDGSYRVTVTAHKGEQTAVVEETTVEL